jgi:TolC family type I secretion outer membrane protein
MEAGRGLTAALTLVLAMQPAAAGAQAASGASALVVGAAPPAAGRYGPQDPPALPLFRDPFADPPAGNGRAIVSAGFAQAETPPPVAATPPPEPPSESLPQPLSPAVPSPPAATDIPGLDPSTPAESLRDAIVAALKTNPDIQIALARQDDARYGIHQANAGYFPKLDMQVALGGEFNDPDRGDQTTLRRGEGVVTMTQTVWDFGVTVNDVKRARADYRSAQWSTRERIEAIAYDIASVYLAVLERQKLVALSLEEIAAHEKILKMVTIQNDLGLNTAADVSRAKARLDNVKAELLDRQSALEQAREGYRRLTDKLPNRAVDLPSPAASLPQTVQQAVDMIDTRSPRLAQAVEDRRSLDRQKASQTGTFFPRIGVMAQGNWKDDVQGRTGLNRDARAMVTVSYSFFNGGADIAIRNRIAARLREADYELERRRREVEQDIRIDFSALEAARAKIGTIDSEIAAAQQTQQLYTQQFREGRRTVFDLLDSQQVLFDARANQVTNLTAKMLAEFRVLQKLGGLFELVSDGQPLPDLVVPVARK